MKNFKKLFVCLMLLLTFGNVFLSQKINASDDIGISKKNIVSKKKANAPKKAKVFDGDIIFTKKLKNLLSKSFSEFCEVIKKYENEETRDFINNPEFLSGKLYVLYVTCVYNFGSCGIGEEVNVYVRESRTALLELNFLCNNKLLTKECVENLEKLSS